MPGYLDGAVDDRGRGATCGICTNGDGRSRRSGRCELQSIAPDLVAAEQNRVTRLERLAGDACERLPGSVGRGRTGIRAAPGVPAVDGIHVVGCRKS